jgi:ABC-type transport system involved in multi-copper enzyme maturation permease subunit
MTSQVITKPVLADPGGVAPPADLRVTQWRLMKSEWLKFWSLRSSWITLAAAVLGMVGFAALIAGVTASRYSSLTPQDKAVFDPVGTSLSGWFIAQLIVSVLGVLLVTGEYGTGMIRATMTAAPKRLPVIWAKAAVFAVVTFTVTAVAALASFYIGQSLLHSQHIDVALTAPGVLHTVLGVPLYLTAVGLFGAAIGWMIRNTAGGIATVFGLLLVLPNLARVLPTSWGDHINPYLPSNAGQEILTWHTDAGSLAPWTGYLVFLIYIAVAFVGAAVVVKRRDA